jgi:hypothetical protein
MRRNAETQSSIATDGVTNCLERSSSLRRPKVEQITRKFGKREGTMDELIGRLVAKCGVEPPVAEKSVGIILDFLRKEGPSDKVQALIDMMPGADALVAAAGAGQSSGGLFGMGGIMGAANRLMGAGLSMGQVQSVTREVVAYAREKAGEDAVGEVVGAIPGLGQFV